MFRSLRLILVLLVVSSCAMAQQKKLVAVLDFDYGTVRSAVQAYFGTDQDVGKGISLLLEQKLVQDGKFRVIDRNAIDKVLKEQNFSNSDRVDATSAAKIGRILGVNAIITGSITQFGRDDKHLGTGGGGYGGGKFGLGGFHKNDSKAVVNVTAKMIDINTAEILAAFTGTGESKRSGFGFGGGGGGGGGGDVDFSCARFSDPSSATTAFTKGASISMSLKTNARRHNEASPKSTNRRSKPSKRSPEFAVSEKSLTSSCSRNGLIRIGPTAAIAPVCFGMSSSSAERNNRGASANPAAPYSAISPETAAITRKALVPMNLGIDLPCDLPARIV